MADKQIFYITEYEIIRKRATVKIFATKEEAEHFTGAPGILFSELSEDEYEFLDCESEWVCDTEPYTDNDSFEQEMSEEDLNNYKEN